jgi:large subunit ribosomal protein L7/L12
LKEAKEMVEGFPKVILKDLKQEQADEFKVKLEELGAIIELV